MSRQCQRANTVLTTHSNTQGGKGSGGTIRLSGSTASEAKENLNSW